MRSIGKKGRGLLQNMAFMTIGNFASKIMNFVLIPIYTAQLTTSEYGSADLIFTTLSLLIPVLSMEINEAVLRFSLDATKEDNRLTFSVGAIISTLSILVFLLLLPLVLMFESFHRYWLYIILLYASNLTYICLTQYAKGNNNVKEYSACGFINTVLVACLNILFLVVFKMKVEGYLLAYILGYSGASVYLLFALRKIISVRMIRKSDLKYVKEMLRYSIPLIPNAVCWWINNAADKYILAIFCNTAAVGLFSIAYKIPSMLSMVTTIFFSAWQISAVEDFGKKECQVFYSKVYRIFFVMNATVCIILICGSKLFAAILYSNDFFSAWKYSVILIVAFFVNALSTFLGSIYTTSKKTKMLLISSVVAAGVNISLNFILIPDYGGYGAGIATLAGYSVILIVRILDTRKIMKLDYQIHENIFFGILMIGCAILALIDTKFTIFLSYVLCALAIFACGLIGYHYMKPKK